MAGFLAKFFQGRRQERTALAPHKGVYPRLVGGMQGARLDRFAASWDSIPTTPDEWTRRWLRILQTRSRFLAFDNPYMKGYIRAVRSNIVGSAGPQLRCIVMRANGKHDRRINKAVTQSWTQWGKAKNCDVTGRESLTSLTLLIAASVAMDGEVFIKLVNDGTYGLQLQLLDPFRCPTDFDRAPSPDGSFIRAGIECNKHDRPIAYYFSADTLHGSSYTVGGRNYERVPADEILHIFRSEVAGQRRGFPWGTSSLFRLKRLQGVEDNTTTSMEVGAGQMGVISWDEGFGPEQDENAPPINFSAEGGTFVELPSGAHLEKWDPKFPDEPPYHTHALGENSFVTQNINVASGKKRGGNTCPPGAPRPCLSVGAGTHAVAPDRRFT